MAHANYTLFRIICWVLGGAYSIYLFKAAGTNAVHSGMAGLLGFICLIQLVHTIIDGIRHHK